MAQAPNAAARLGVGLGWFSLALGLVALLRPALLARYAGVPHRPRSLRVFGLRELASGAGILLRPHKAGWLWSRVAGDAIDLGLLMFTGRRHPGRRVALATAALAGVTALDTLAAIARGQRQRFPAGGDAADDAAGIAAARAGKSGARGTFGTLSTIRVTQSININQHPEACYHFWRNFENFPRFMKHVAEVRMLDATRSQWKVRAPLGRQVTWTAELVSDVPSQQLGWRTLPGAEIDHAGVVRFVPALGERGTRVEVDLSYRAPLGKAGSQLAKLFGEEPSQQIDDDLRRFKQLIETGEIATTVGQAAGRRSLVGRILHRGAAG